MGELLRKIETFAPPTLSFHLQEINQDRPSLSNAMAVWKPRYSPPQSCCLLSSSAGSLGHRQTPRETGLLRTQPCLQATAGRFKSHLGLVRLVSLQRSYSTLPPFLLQIGIFIIKHLLSHPPPHVTALLECCQFTFSPPPMTSPASSYLGSVSPPHRLWLTDALRAGIRNGETQLRG